VGSGAINFGINNVGTAAPFGAGNNVIGDNWAVVMSSTTSPTADSGNNTVIGKSWADNARALTELGLE
jgi:hypothetical protein